MGKDVIIACDFSSKADVMAFLDKFTEVKPFVDAEGQDINFTNPSNQ